VLSVAKLEYVARKLFGILSFICEARDILLRIKNKLDNVVTDVSLERVSLMGFTPRKNIGRVELNNVCYFSTHLRTSREVSVHIYNIKHDIFGFDEYTWEIVRSTILFPDRVKPLDNVAEELKNEILSSARRHGLGGVIGKGVEFEYEKLYEVPFILSDKGIKEIENIMNSLGKTRCDSVYFFFTKVLNGKIIRYSSVRFYKGKFETVILDSYDVSYLVSASDWFVKQLIVIAENVG